MSPNLNFDPTKDYYKALGVSESASADEIKKAYRKLAKKYHPDVTGGDKAKVERFKEVTTAYEVLGDDEKRGQYDAIRKGGFNPYAGAAGTAGGAAGFDFGDLFSQFFGGQARGGPGGGATYRVYTSGGGPGGEVPFESFFGGAAPGYDPFEQERPQQRRRRPRKPRPAAPTERKIRASDGSALTQRGHDVHSDVRLAIDEAVLGTTKSVATLSGRATVKIPPGTSSGVKLRLKGKGVAKPNGGQGDHFVTVHIDVPKRLDEDAKRALVEFMKKAKK